jgi:SAM-dependent methyltransferase
MSAIIEGFGRKARDRIEHFLRVAIDNDNTRRAYGRALGSFFAFLEMVDATALPFPDSSFDAVVCQFGVMFFPDKDKSYREVHRVLAPGGHYLFSVWDSHVYNKFGRIQHEVPGSFFPADPPHCRAHAGQGNPGRNSVCTRYDLREPDH